MSSRLPQRAKPEVVYNICRAMKDEDEFSREAVYQATPGKTRDLRRAITLALHLGFFRELDDDTFQITKRGTGLGYQSSFDDNDTVSDLFREGIEDFELYRDIFVRTHDSDSISEVIGDDCVTQSVFRDAAEAVIGEEVDDREINLLIKTADAAGLGEYRAGKRGYETRLILTDDYESFVARLSEEYAASAVTVDRASETEQSDQIQDENTGASDASSDTGSVTITVELEVGDRTGDEIAAIVDEIRRATDD